MAQRRRTITQSLRIQVLTEAGYRCAVPTCRNILALDLHHIVPVAEDGPNALANLIALCPTCHALFTRGEISRDSIYMWKATLVALSHAFDFDTIDALLFLNQPAASNLRISGDGVLRFFRLIAGGLATFGLVMQNGPLLLYQVRLTDRGRMLVEAWKRGDRAAVERVSASNSPIGQQIP